mgnify:CR=1 FL=1
MIFVCGVTSVGKTEFVKATPNYYVFSSELMYLSTTVKFTMDDLLRFQSILERKVVSFKANLYYHDRPIGPLLEELRNRIKMCDINREILRLMLAYVDGYFRYEKVITDGESLTHPKIFEFLKLFYRNQLFLLTEDIDIIWKRYIVRYPKKEAYKTIQELDNAQKGLIKIFEGIERPHGKANELRRLIC